MSNSTLFQGDVRVYLEGSNALEVAEPISDSLMTYFIGSTKSFIRIKDFRKAPMEAARRALLGQDGYQFADVFNEPAWIEIISRGDTIEIEMHESLSDKVQPTLWLGVLEDEIMPVHKTQWEVLKPVEQTRTAFAAIVVD